MVFWIPNCSWCGAPLPPRSPRGGRPQRYCSDRCRQAACRDRRSRLERAQQAGSPASDVDSGGLRSVADLADLAGPHGLDDLELPARSVPSPDEELVLAVLEARSAAAAFARLGVVARRDFAWRCELTAGEIHRTLEQYFPEAQG